MSFDPNKLICKEQQIHCPCYLDGDICCFCKKEGLSGQDIIDLMHEILNNKNFLINLRNSLLLNEKYYKIDTGIN